MWMKVATWEQQKFIIINTKIPNIKIPEEKVLIQELLSANVGQGKHPVDRQEQSAVDGH